MTNDRSETITRATGWRRWMTVPGRYPIAEITVLGWAMIVAGVGQKSGIAAALIVGGIMLILGAVIMLARKDFQR